MEIHRLPGKGHYNTSLLVINCIDKNTTNNERDMKNVITNKAIVFFELQYKPTSSLKSVLQWWNLAVIPYLKKIQKLYETRDTPLEFWWHHHFLPEISKFCYIKKKWYRLHFDTVSNFLNIFWVLKIVLINMVTNLMMSAKMATLTILKMKAFWNKGYDVITCVHDVTNKFL